MAYLTWFFWDGRADSLWAQALGPPENPNEHGISRTLCAQVISEHYRKEYEEIFGPLPDFPKDICLPVARPDPEDKTAYTAWTSMPPAKADEITRVYSNMGKAIAAYERLILPGSSRFDRYVEALLKGDREGMSSAMDIRAVGGLRLFIGKAKCVECHSGPLFTNGEFRKTGMYQPAELPPDAGRAEGLKKVISDEFNCLGKYSDARKDDCTALKSLDTDASKYAGAFKVPTLRNVAERPPYMHAGQYWALWEVLRFYGRMKP
jgi:cytochrome c peroxidase